MVGILFYQSPSFPLETGFLTGLAARQPTSNPQRSSCLLSLHPWDYKCMQSYLDFFFFVGMLGFELRSVSLSHKHSFLPTEPSPQLIKLL